MIHLLLLCSHFLCGCCSTVTWALFKAHKYNWLFCLQCALLECILMEAVKLEKHIQAPWNCQKNHQCFYPGESLWPFKKRNLKSGSQRCFCQELQNLIRTLMYTIQCNAPVFMPYVHFYLSRNVNVLTKTLLSEMSAENQLWEYTICAKTADTTRSLRRHWFLSLPWLVLYPEPQSFY